MDEQLMQQIKDFLINKLDPSFIMVFGSFAKDTTHKNSDIDIAFYKPALSLPTYEIFLIAQELADIIKLDVDLIDLQTSTTVFRAQVYSTGIVVYSKDDPLLRLEQMRALSMYARFNEERKSIIQKVDESGSIYEK
ncbi:type VII toxin-antitoxin system MntA family adenylyltransferase antitoxin [Peribacillus kribbensis]|uniref:type VII toxin-antitoxin system MntA family adenylyltransferase antitoxin n=1 Tax=Peribacillus kribbensis TaxID=356658 RepID=UPI0003FDF338|nr:nucleotidyltransferase domain-containing protein [Peribacillus kribbensis]